MDPFINLDANATTPLLPAAREAMLPLLTEPLGNASSVHGAGRRARRLLEDARERIAALLGAFPDEVLFTSGATEANNLALFGLPAKRIVASPMEHPCVAEPLRILERRGAAIAWLPVEPDGRVSVSAYQADLAVLQLANHETGALQPVREWVEHLPHAAIHTDAAQAVGKVPVHFHELGATTLAASAHKFGGPPGIGFLLVKRGTSLHPQLFGGHQQQGRRPGTEPIAAMVGMTAALEEMLRDLAEHRAKLESLRAHLWRRLQERAAPVHLNGPPIGSPHAVPTTLNVSFPDCRGDLLLMALDLAGVACSTGSACSSGSLVPSPVLAAMGLPEDLLRSAIRFSFTAALPAHEVEAASVRIGTAVQRLRES
jgi:cysteine desulfurase